MGMKYLVQYVGWGCPDLTGRSFRVLCRMAIPVMDDPTDDGMDEGLYYAGMGLLGGVLGYGLWDRERDMSPAAKRAVSRAITELREAGYISVAPRDKQMHERNRTYQLHYPDITKPRKPRLR